MSMSVRAASGLLVLMAALGSQLLLPSPAFAHGIGGDAATASVVGFVGIGIEHMVLGWDHILFIAGVVLLAGAWRRAAKLISVFVVGHSITLITATLAGWQVNATLVDVVIVLSVVFVGGYGMVGRPRAWDVFGGIVFGFGLVHGLGLATRFQALGVPEDGLVWRLIAFNVGIEIGQLTAIVAVLALVAVVSMSFGVARHAALLKTTFAALFVVGTVVAPMMAYRGFTEVNGDVSNVALPEGSRCAVGNRTETFPAAGGEHTAKRFYGPGDEVPIENFGHALGDGYVLIFYPPRMPESDQEALREFVDGAGLGVMAAPHQDTTAGVKAVTVRQTMSCESLQVGALRQFSSTWLASLGAGT
jgi:hydrogenase/urease accessory protein HupE